MTKTMKKIMTDIKTLAALLIAGAAFTACSSDDNYIANEQPVNPAQKTYTLTILASKDAAATRSLSLDGSTLNATWTVGEKVTVYNVTKSAELSGTLTAQGSGASTMLSGTLIGTIEVSDELTLKFLSPSYSTQDGTLTGSATSIDKVCDYAEATVTVARVSDGNITTNEDADFQNKQAIVKFMLTYNDAPSTSFKTSQLIVVADGNTYTITPEQSTNILYLAIPGINKKSIRLYSNGRTYTKTDVSFKNGQYYAITVKMKSPSTPSGVEAIDLGLPSGTLWANMNIGASTPEEYGDYFSWGEVVPKSNYDYSTYKYCNGSYDTMTKYCTDPSVGNVDNLTSLDSFDDAAYMNWGNNWRMPTKDQIQELIDYTNNEWISDYNGTGINGFKYSKINDASIYIFIPAAGMRHESGLYFNGVCGRYWSSSVFEYGSSNAYINNFEESIGAHRYAHDRASGFPVRPVFSN